MSRDLCGFLEDDAKDLDDGVLEDEYPADFRPVESDLRLGGGFDSVECRAVERACGGSVLDEEEE